jgi:hypothetical protein
MRTKIFLAGVILLLQLPVNAQFSKGDRMIGASLGSLLFNSGTADISVASIGSNSSRITGYNVNFSPSLAWFLSDKTAVGLTLNINPNHQKTTYEQSGSTYQSDQQTSFNFGVGGLVRNYFAGKSMLPFVQFSLNGGISSLKTEGFFYGGSGSSAYKTSYTGSANGGAFFNSSLSGGLTKMLGENAGLDFYLGYTFSYNKNVFKKTTLRDDGVNGSIDTRAENETTTKFTNHGFNAGVGFQFFLRKKK